LNDSNRFLPGSVIDVDHDHTGAFTGKPEGGFTADAAASAGDEGYFIE
jgi:hypothetical protein